MPEEMAANAVGVPPDAEAAAVVAPGGKVEINRISIPVNYIRPSVQGMKKEGPHGIFPQYERHALYRQVAPMKFPYGFDDESGVGRLVPSSTEGLRRKEGRIGLGEQEAPGNPGNGPP